MKTYSNISELVGNTPLVILNKLNTHADTTILVKLEQFNPSGSVKDRAVYNMIKDAEDKGKLSHGATIIEATSGNTGIALATIAAARGYKLILVIPDTMSIDKINRVKALGAEVILTPGIFGMTRAYRVARELAENTPGSFMPNQMENPANPDMHQFTTADEIWKDTDGKIDVFVAGIGTGGTITGTARGLKQFNKNIVVVGVEPAGSPILTKGKRGPHKIQGIGAGFVPKILDLTVVDQITTISDEDALDTARELARREGIFVGISSGAAVKAALNYVNYLANKKKIIVVLLADTGERYLNTELFNHNYNGVFVS